MFKYKGLSLLELIITMSIAVVIVAVAVPSMSHYLSQSEARSASSLLFRYLSNTRMLAANKKRVVTMCGVNEQFECVAQNFTQIIIFEDENRDGVQNTEDQLFYTTQLNITGELKLKASFGRTYIRFKDNGHAEQAGSFIYCKTNTPSAARRVTVSLAGRAYLGKDEDGDGIVEETSGEPISCS